MATPTRERPRLSIWRKMAWAFQNKFFSHHAFHVPLDIISSSLNKPLRWAKSSAYSWKDREYFFLGQLPYLTGAECLKFEGITLVVIVIHSFFPLSYEGCGIYWRDTLNQLKAEDGVGLPEQILQSSSFQRSARYYFIFTKFDLIWSLGYFALIVLNFLKKPLWCAKSRAYSWKDREYFFLGQLPYLTGAECLIYEGITLVVIVIHTFFPLSYEGSGIYWRNTVNQLKVFCLILLVADILVFALYLSPVGFNYLPIRIAPYIRVVLFTLNIRELRSSMVILAGMLDTYLIVLALGLLFLLFSSWVGYVMFEDTQQGKTIFTSYQTTLYQMFFLFTTSNYPDVWIPAYKASRWFCLFFILFVLLGVYFVTNLVLAVVYDSFKNELVKQVSEMDRMRRSILDKAFNLLDRNHVGHLNKDQCIKLFMELNKYRTLPKTSEEEFGLIFDELDDSHDVKIDMDEFADLCNAIALKFQKEEIGGYIW